MPGHSPESMGSWRRLLVRLCLCWNTAARSSAGSGIPYAIESGFRAGSSAANFASGITQDRINGEEVAELKANIFAPLARHSGLRPDDIIYEIQEIVSPIRYNYIRAADRIKEAIARARHVQDKLIQLWAKDSHELVKCYEAKSLVLCAEVSFKAALMRTESRGCHRREDYPKRDDHNWLKWVITAKKGEEMKLWTEPVPFESYRFKPT